MKRIFILLLLLVQWSDLHGLHMYYQSTNDQQFYERYCFASSMYGGGYIMKKQTFILLFFQWSDLDGLHTNLLSIYCQSNVREVYSFVSCLIARERDDKDLSWCSSSIFRRVHHSRHCMHFVVVSLLTRSCY